MNIEQLLLIVAPPEQPVESTKGQDWTTIEKAIGTALPQDYKDYLRIYGSGLLVEFIWIANPFSKDKWLLLQNRIKLDLEALRETRRVGGVGECPYSIYPEADGLLPWGFTINGDALYWLTSGNPNLWTVVINESRGPEFEHFDESMTSFLAKVISGDIQSDIFPEDFVNWGLPFEPLNPNS